MSIGNFYRNFLKKSRSFFKRVSKGPVPRLDLFLLIAAVAVLVIFFAGRTAGGTGTPKRTEIYISSQCGDLFGKDLTAALIREFEGQNPDLRILTAPPPAPGGGDSADILFFDDTEFAKLINAAESDGLSLVSLSPYIHSETQTEPRAVPLVLFIDLFFYNVDILKAADRIRPPKTRTEFVATARAVAEAGPADNSADTVYSFALGLNREDPLALRRDIYPWIWADGGEVAAVTGAGGTALSRPAIDIINFFGQLNREGILAPGTFEKTGAQRLKEFAEGKIAMITASARDIPFLRHAAWNINFDITAMPAPGFSKNRLGFSGIYGGISSGCTLQDEAWTFLAFVAGKRQVLSTALGAVPGIFSGVIPGEYIEEDPLYSKAWEIFEAADIIEYTPDRLGEDGISRMVWDRLAEVIR